MQTFVLVGRKELGWVSGTEPDGQTDATGVKLVLPKGCLYVCYCLNSDPAITVVVPI